MASKVDSVMEHAMRDAVISKRNDRLRDLDKILYDHAYYYPSVGGKRVRPFVAVMAGGLFGKPTPELYLAAASVELLHNFTLVDDDIMDGDKTRRGRKTAHEAFGLGDAVNAGACLYAMAIRTASEAEGLSGAKRLVATLADASLTIVQGQNLDVRFEQIRDVTIEEYLDMIYKKTATLIECAAEMGGLVGIAQAGREASSPSILRSLKEYGRNQGLAFQIHDDYLGTFGDPSVVGKPVGNDLIRGKKTCIVILAQKSASKAQMSVISSILGNSTAERRDLERAIKVLKDLGIDRMVLAMGEQYANKALAALSSIPQSEERDLLADLAGFVSSRKS